MGSDVLVYSYVRMSSVGQIKGDSERRQVDQAKEFAVRHGHTLAPPLRDLGVSAFRGTHRKKGALGVFLKGLADGTLQPGILVIEAIDRLSREPPMEILMLLRDILATGTAIHLLSLNQTLTATSFAESTWLLPAIASMAGLAHAESVQKSQRIEAAYRERQKQARAGKVLRGNYHPAWLGRIYHDDDTVEHVVIPEVADPVRRIFQLAATGMGHHSISRVLNAERVPVVPACFGKSPEALERASRRRWYQAYVGRLLLDRRTLGEYQPKRIVNDKSVPEGEPIPGHFPAIISQELWDSVRQAANPKHGRKTGGRKLRFANLLTTLARCDTCGSNMLLHGNYPRAGGVTRQYLRCACNQQGSQCTNTRMPRYEWLEAKILAALPGIPWRDLIRNVPGDSATEEVSKQIDEVSTRIDRLNRSGARLLTAIEESDDPVEQIAARYREIQADIGLLTKRRDILVQDREALRRNTMTDDHAVDEAAELIRLMATDDEAERFVIRQKLHGVLKRVIETVRCNEHGWAMVHIRGGLCLRVPYEKDGQVEVGLVAGGFNDFMAQKAKGGLVPLAPDAEGRRLVQAFNPAGYMLGVEGAPMPGA